MYRKYAQTNIHLYHQLQRGGYSNEEIGRVRQAYELATELFCCLYRPSGKTFISHLVGTASILASLHVSLDVVLAGLLHAAYSEGDFGDLRKKLSEPTRQKVRAIIGDTAEEYVRQYARLPWNRETVSALYRNVSDLGSDDRTIVLMRLANDLEDHLDRGILYCHNAKDRLASLKSPHNLLVASAEKLGYSVLASELNRVLQETLQYSINNDLISQGEGKGVLRKIPFSYRQRFTHYLYQRVSIIWDRLGDAYLVIRKKASRHKKKLRTVLQR